MESISTFFKKENDLLYMLGEYLGEEKGREEGMEQGVSKFIKFLLERTDYSVEKIAAEAGVSVDFVKKVKASI